MAQYTPITNTLAFAVSFAPQTAFPLDNRTLFGSYEAAYAAAQTAEDAGSTNTVYYFGQMLTVVGENGIVAHYTIMQDKTLEPVGAQVIGDDKTVTIGEDGEIGLHAFGVEYFKYFAPDVVLAEVASTDALDADAAVGAYCKVAGTWYQKGEAGWAVAAGAPNTAGHYELTQGWIDGLEPRAILNSEGNGYELAWYQPSSITLEGVSSAISSMQETVNNLDGRVTTAQGAADAAQAAADAAQETANQAAASAQTANDAIAVLNGTAETEGSVRHTVAAELAALVGDGSQETIDSLTELVEWANEHAADVITLENNVTANATAITAINNLLGTSLPEGTNAANVIEWIGQAFAAIQAETERATAAEEALGGRITALEQKTADYDASKFATAEQGAKADTAVQLVVKGQTNGHIAVDGTDIEVYKLGAANVTELGGIKPDGTSIGVNSDGVASVTAVDHTKVTGLGTQLEATKEAAVAEANAYTDENAVLVGAIATSENVAENSAAASDAKVVSEKMFMEALEWKTTM